MSAFQPSTTRVIPNREDGEGPHKCSRGHANHHNNFLESGHAFASSLASLGMTAPGKK